MRPVELSRVALLAAAVSVLRVARAATCHTVTMTDSWGDGWGVGYLEITDDLADNEVVFSTTLTTGSSAETTVCLPDGYYTLVVDGGEWPSEVR